MAKKSCSKKTIVLIASAAAVVLVTAVMILLTLGASPVDKVIRAAKKTAFSDSFTTLYSVTVDGKTVDGVMNAAIDPEANKMDVYIQMADRSAERICGIYNGTFVESDLDGSNGYTVAVGDRIDAFFHALGGGDPHWQTLLDSEIYDQLTGDFDIAVLQTCFNSWLEMLNRKSWAQDHAGYQTYREDGARIYSFSPDLTELIQESLPVFRPAFREESRYDALVEYLDNVKFLLADGKADVSFGVKGGKLVSANMDLRYHNTSVQVSLEFIGIGVTQVDVGTLAFAIDDANKKTVTGESAPANIIEMFP